MNQIQKSLFIFFLLFIVWATNLFGQAETDFLSYKRQLTIGIQLNTVGDLPGGFNLKYSWRNTYKMYHTLSLDIMNIRNPKEFRVPTDSIRSNTYITGKRNYLYSVRLMYGPEFILFRSHKEEGIQLSLLLAGGPSFGLLKPYYVLTGSHYTTAKYTNAPSTIGSQKIYVEGSFTDFWSKTQLILGVSAKASLLFEIGVFDNLVTGLELGTHLEYFSSRPIIGMDANSNNQGFASVFATLYLGFKSSDAFDEKDKE